MDHNILGTKVIPPSERIYRLNRILCLHCVYRTIRFRKPFTVRPMVVVVLEVLEAGVAQPIQRKLNFTWDLLEMIRLLCLFHILFKFP